MSRTPNVRRLTLLLGALAVGLAPLVPAAIAATNPHYYKAEADRDAYGPWVQVGTHRASVTYTIEASPVGKAKTEIVGEVSYFSADGWKVKPLNGVTKITTGDYGPAKTRIGDDRPAKAKTKDDRAPVRVHFKGHPLASKVIVKVTP